MTTTDHALLILDLATDDFVGLWEIDWRAQSVEKQKGLAVDRAALRLATTRLLDDGEIMLYHGVLFNGDETQVGTSEARAVIAEARAWEPSRRGEPHFRICATQKGDAEYKRRFGEPNP